MLDIPRPEGDTTLDDTAAVLPDIEDNPPPSEITDATLGRTAAGLADDTGCTAGVIDAAVERALN